MGSKPLKRVCLLKPIDDRTIYILKSRLKGRRLREIAAELNLSVERVRQLEYKGLRKIRLNYRVLVEYGLT